MANLLTQISSAAASMNVYERALEVVQNDVTNATTPGYVRQTANFQALPFDTTGGGLSGGVKLGNTSSSRDEYAEHNVQTQQSALVYSSTVAANLSGIEPAFDLQSKTGIAGSLNTLFASFSQLSVNPNDAQMRQSVLTAANQVAGAFNNAAAALANSQTAVEKSISNTVTNLNAILADLQKVNLAKRSESSPNADPGLDARLYANLEKLSQFSNISVISDQDGTVSVMLQGGKPLLIGTTAYPLSVSDSGGSKVITNSEGTDVTSSIGGGQLGGLLKVRNDLLPQYRADLDTLATSFANQVNTQLAAGRDKNGAIGSNLFQYGTASAASLSLTNITADQIAAASTTNAGGNDNAIALAKLKDSNLPSLSYNAVDGIGNLASGLGRDLTTAKNDQTTQTQLLSQASTLRAQSSAVSLNEEAARMTEYQRAYQATSRLISVINEMTQTLLGIIPG